MVRVDKLDTETFSVSKFHEPSGAWVTARLNGQETFTTREAAENFAASLEEIERSRNAYEESK